MVCFRSFVGLGSFRYAIMSIFYMNGILYNLCGKTTLRMTLENFRLLSLPEMCVLLHDVNAGKIDLVLEEKKNDLSYL